MTRRFLVSVSLATAALVAGCSKQTPVSVTEVNDAIRQAKDACATTYAADDLATLQPKVDEMNRLVQDGKMRKAGKQAEGLTSEVASLRTRAETARVSAKTEAEAAVTPAEQALTTARNEQAAELAAADFGRAEAKLAEARAAAKDPCRYADAPRLAMEAQEMADRARTTAVAEAKRRAEEEARRRAEEERRRAEEEARRLAEAEARKHYVVAKGDCLWKIAGMNRIYDDPGLWPVIYDANRNLITNPDLIYPGQELLIPRDITAEEMKEKVRQQWASDRS